MGRLRPAQQTGYAPLGSVEIDSAAEAVVGDDGETVYLAAESGFATIDISEPANPTVLAERRDLLADRDHGPMEGIIDIKVDGDRLVVPGPGNPRQDEVVTGFLLYDVSDPADPKRVAFFEAQAPIHNADIDDDLVYLTQRATVAIIDVSGDEPAPVGEIEITDFDSRWGEVFPALRRPHDVWVQDSVAYVPCWEAGTWVVDTSDPGSPELVTHIEGRPFAEVDAVAYDEIGLEGTQPPGNHHYAQTSADGRILAIGKESWDVDPGDDIGGPSGIELWDVSEAGAPIKLSEIHPPRADDETRQGTWTTSHNFDIVGDRLYTSWYQGGVKIFDISDPGTPEELVWWRDPERAAFWTAVRATEAFIVASSTDIPVGVDLTEGLFTFPTEIGEQEAPPTRPMPAESPSQYRTARPTPTPTPTPTLTPSPTHTEAPTPTKTPGQPGFGVIGALAGLGGGLWWFTRGPDDSE